MARLILDTGVLMAVARGQRDSARDEPEEARVVDVGRVWGAVGGGLGATEGLAHGLEQLGRSQRPCRTR